MDFALFVDAQGARIYRRGVVLHKPSSCGQDNNTAGEVCDTEDSQLENSNVGAEATPLVVTNKNREPESQTTGVIRNFAEQYYVTFHVWVGAGSGRIAGESLLRSPGPAVKATLPSTKQQQQFFELEGEAYAIAK